MTAFFVATLTVKDKDKLEEYARRAGSTVAAYGGELVLRGTADEALSGTLDHQAVGIMRFPDREALSAWFHSPEYQAIVPLRDAAADMAIIAYSSPA